MLYLFLIFLFLIPVVLIAGIVYAFKKLTRKKFFILLLVIFSSPYILFKIYERNYMLSSVPDALEVNSISYKMEESWGIGPGANEAGIRVYPLSEAIAKEIEQNGIKFFDTMPPNKNQKINDWHGRFENWAETPITESHHWAPKENPSVFNIYEYVCKYGHIDIKPEIMEQANSIVNGKGSYYAYGRLGLIVVSPKNRIVLYMYNG
jgi:hypothetical protein